MPKTMANHVRINYAQLGEGPDLVMIHGLAASLAYWYVSIASELAKRFRVTVYDLRGHGFSEMAPSGYTTETLATDLRELMDALDIRRAHLVGHSYGGAVSLHFALQNPDRARSLSLIDSRVNAVQPIRGLDDTQHWAERQRALKAAGISVPEGTPKIAYAMLEELMPDDPDAGGPDSNGLGGFMSGHGFWKPNSRAAQRWMKLVSTTSFADDIKKEAGLTRQRISQIQAPSMLSYGEKSGCLETCRSLERLLPICRTHVQPGVGHFFPSIRPDLVVGDVQEFLASSPLACTN